MARAPKGKGQPVLYLDIDGVLHHESVYWHPRRGVYLKAPERYVLFQHAQLLDELLAPFPSIAVVISSNWQRRYRFGKLLKRLTPALRSRVLGGTYHSEMNGDSYDRLPRWSQILRDVQRRQPAAWLAVDDDHGDWPAELRDHLVACDACEGISPPEIQDDMRAKLAALVNDAALVHRAVPEAASPQGAP